MTNQRRDGSFGLLTREEFMELVAAPWGEARERLQDPYDIAHIMITRAILNDYLPQLRDNFADEEFLQATVSEMVSDLIEMLERRGFLKV